MIPQPPGAIIEQVEFITQPSRTHKDSLENVVGFVDGIEALKQSLLQRMSIERYAYPIYSDDYGIEIKQYIGNTFEFLEATIERTLYDCCIQDDRVTNVIVLKVERIALNAALVEFNAVTNLGIIEMERKFYF